MEPEPVTWRWNALLQSPGACSVCVHPTEHFFCIKKQINLSLTLILLVSEVNAIFKCGGGNLRWFLHSESECQKKCLHLFGCGFFFYESQVATFDLGHFYMRKKGGQHNNVNNNVNNNVESFHFLQVTYFLFSWLGSGIDRKCDFVSAGGSISHPNHCGLCFSFRTEQSLPGQGRPGEANN